MGNLSVEQKEAVAIVRIDRPQRLNALNSAVLKELQEYLKLAADQPGLKAVILTGTGDKAFIAGADIKEMQGMNPLEMIQFCTLGQSVAEAFEQAPFLTIAAVNGYALGGGLEMALACDFIYASQNAKLGLPEVSLGIIPGFGGTQRLSRAIGTRQAKEMVMSGKMIGADEAKELGIVNRVCEEKGLLEECISAAQSIVKHSKTAFVQAKRAIDIGFSMPLDAGLELEKNMCAVCFATPERLQAMTAFANKTKGVD